MNDDQSSGNRRDIPLEVFNKLPPSDSSENKTWKSGSQLGTYLYKFQDYVINATEKVASALDPDASQGDWNEKTVEYHFARFILRRNSFANPLDGNDESMWGDLITGERSDSGGKYCLIEFKAKSTDFDSEYDKYVRTMNSYGPKARPVDADGKRVPFRAWLSSENEELLKLSASSHHYFVYGAITDKTFGLKFEPYTNESGRNPSPLKRFDTLQFCDHLKLIEYLPALAAARLKGPPPGDGGPSFYNDARTAAISRFNTTLVLSDSGYVMTVAQKLEEVTSIFRQWLTVPPAQREQKMQECLDNYISNRRRKPGPGKADGYRAEIRQAYEVTRLLEEMEATVHARQMTRGAS